MTGVKRGKSKVSADSSIKKHSLQNELIEKLLKEYFHESDSGKRSENLKTFLIQILESSEQCTAVCSIPELEILYITPAMAELLGIKTKNQLKVSLDKYLLLKSRTIFKKQLIELKPNVSILKIEAGIFHGDEDIKKTEFAIRKIILDDKTIALIFSSDRHEGMSEIEKLKRSEEHYRTLVENIYGVFFSIDEKGVIRYASPAVEKLTGYKPKELIGKAFPELIYPEDLPGLFENFKTTMSGQLGTYDYRIIKKKGGHFWARSYSHVIGSPDNPGGLNGILIDITDEVESETALKESEARYRILFSDSPDAYLIISDGIIVNCNRASETLLRGTREQIVGQRPGTISPEFQANGRNSDELAEELLKEAQRTEGMVFEWVHNRFDGSQIQVEVSLSPMVLDGRWLLFASLRDITNRKQAEEEREKLRQQLNQSQKMESVGRLAGGVAHDFNNMLAVILGHTELLLERVDSDHPLVADLQEIRKAAERSADLTRQLLTFARKQTVAPMVLDLNQTVEGMLKMLRRLIGEDIDLVWLPGENLGYVMMDPSQIDQILANLCINARDAIGDTGKITIETEMVTFDKDYCSQHAEFFPGEYIMMAVSDDGSGIDPETISLVFEPFFTTKEIGKGTGLGLSTVYGIVKQNNGYINVYSENGLGTTFKMYFPRYHGDFETHPEKLRTGAMTGTETVLIVEDYEEILNLAVEILEHHGYKVLKAKNPEEAILTAGQFKGDIHLLITDVVLPAMNGKDLEEKIKTTRPNIKTLFMSGYTADIIAQRGVIEQGVSFLQKPFTVKSLTMKVRDALNE